MSYGMSWDVKEVERAVTKQVKRRVLADFIGGIEGHFVYLASPGVVSTAFET